jgi:predicted nucleotidyltransferase
MSRNPGTGLSDEDLNNIVRIIEKNPKITDAVLFGSRAKGTFSNGSDIDIALKGEDLSLNDVLDLSIELEELFLPYKFDLVIYERIKEEALKEHITRVGVSIFRREKE